MSDQYEPSYYEIALTGRQVLAAFVILLVCMVAAFFSGVWVGRGGTEADERSPEEARAEPFEGAGDEEARLEELSFFEDGPMNRPQDLGEVAREARPNTTLREDLEGPAADAGPAVPPAPATPPDEPAEAEEEPAPQPPPPPRPEEPAPAREANPSGSLSTGDIVIQVFSTGEEAKAREVLDRLERNGFRAFLSPAVDAGRTLYRVRVGPFEHRSEAEEVAERLRSSLNMETWITQ